MIKHGLYGTAFYSTWAGMKARCLNKNNQSFQYYGQVGVVVCDEWLNFINFRNDMYSSYLKHKETHQTTTIDRVDSCGNYCPENCRWITKNEQPLNRRKPLLDSSPKKSPNKQECATAKACGKLICYCCSHTWYQRIETKPIMCPACKSRKWEDGNKIKTQAQDS